MVNFNLSYIYRHTNTWRKCKENVGMSKPMNKMEVHIEEYMEYWGGSKVLIC